jgi:hypothetical protein
MLLLASGVVVLVVNAMIFWSALPRDGRKYRFADTAWEPYVGVALTAGFALGVTLLITGIIHMSGS